MSEKITEEFVVNQIIKFMINKENGNWHEEKVENLQNQLIEKDDLMH